jgi:probable rRNA maturation factor
MSARHVVLVSGSMATDTLVDEAERLLPLALDVLANRSLAPTSCEISVLLTGDDEIRDLNKRFRSIDAATDVLSFSQLEGDLAGSSAFPDGEPVPVGDIVISIPTMRAQAREYGHGEAREFGFLLVHGLLHIVGFDHQDAEDERAMRAAQEELLVAVGLPRGETDDGAVR